MIISDILSEMTSSRKSQRFLKTRFGPPISSVAAVVMSSVSFCRAPSPKAHCLQQRRFWNACTPAISCSRSDVRPRQPVSIGIAEHRRGDLPESLVGHADQALYAAKRAGKNTIRIFGEDQGNSQN